MAAVRSIAVFAGIKTEAWLFTEMRQEFPPHFHDCILAGMLLSGRRLFRYGNYERIIQTGGLVVLPPGLSHSCKPLGRHDGIWVCLHIALPGSISIEPAFASDARLADDFYRLGELLMRGTHANAGWLPALKNRIMALLAPRLAPARNLDERVQRLCSFLDSHWREQVSLGEMAKFARLEKFQMLRKFRAVTGLTPYRYLESRRLLNAQKLLRRGAGLAACAASSGYYDQSHFSRCFKANMGVTPGGYRRSWSAPVC